MTFGKALAFPRLSFHLPIYGFWGGVEPASVHQNAHPAVEKQQVTFPMDPRWADVGQPRRSAWSEKLQDGLGDGGQPTTPGLCPDGVVPASLKTEGPPSEAQVSTL